MEALRIDDFGFAYPKSDSTLSHVDLTVQAGEFLLLIGDTGSGKTTLLRNMKPELAPVGTREGSISLFGQTLAYDTTDCLTEDAGYVFQNPANQIVCDTVWHELAFGLENLGTDPDVMRRRVAEVAHFFGIEPWMHRQTNSLSGGQKQTLNLASILAMHPRLLLLDEPTAQLDPVAEKNFFHALFRINRELGITVIAATHTPEVMADYATGCVRVQDGRLVAEDIDVYRAFAAPETPLFVRQPMADEKVLPDEGKSGEGASTSGKSEVEPAVAIDEVFFRFSRNDDYVLHGTSLEVSKGEIHAIVGGNGSGKTTMLHLIAGAYRAEHGKVENAYPRQQALMPQDPKALFVCDSIADELAEWQERCGYTDDDIARIEKEFGFDAMTERHPYDLSGGQQQELAIAKLLLTDPELLLLDEPTKGLDGTTRVEIADILLDLRAKGRTMILVTHDLSFVKRVADRVSLLFDGEVACTQSASSFFNENLFYRPINDSFARLWDQR